MNIDYNAVIEVLKSFLNNEKIEILGISVGEERQVKDAIRNLLTAYEKEKEKNKRAEELYMQHNQMIIDILKECNYMIKNRYYMNDTAIRQHAEDIKNIAKYYIKQPEWEEE